MKCLAILILGFLAVMAISVQVAASSAHLKKQGAYYFVVGPSSLGEPGKGVATLEKVDINGDGKVETLKILTTFGASSDVYQLKIFSSLGKLLGSFGFSSDGGCALGSIIGGPKQQIAIWKMVWQEDESHMGSHFYNVTVYDWDKKGKLAESCFYRTKRKYGLDSSPWLEFLKNKAQAIAIMGLKVEPVSVNDLKVIRRLGLKQMPRRTKIIGKSVRKVGPWVIFFRYQPPENWNGEWELWQKKNGSWKNLTVFGSPDGDEEWSNQIGMPVSVWRKLWDNQNIE